VSSAPTHHDGRRARRERNRAAVIDAMLALLQEGRFPPSVEELAGRAEVSVSSVFRYFDNLDDLHHETIVGYFERYAPLFEVPARPDGSLADRVQALVEARLELYETIAPIARVARLRAADQAEIGATLLDTRRRFLGQVRDHFAPDLAGRADADDVVVLCDALTSFEAWDLLQGTHERSRPQIARAWTTGLTALVG
jgi:AcrR family transcriptional regulator